MHKGPDIVSLDEDKTVDASYWANTFTESPTVLQVHIPMELGFYRTDRFYV